jgi:AraC-like DNA-binding protein
METERHRRNAVQRMQDHIEERLREPITLNGLAHAARYSPYYAARLFREHTGKSPFEYIRLRRLTAAAGVLRDRRTRIVDVAFDFVFDTHEGFSRAFARQFGMTPSRYRRSGGPLPLFLPDQMRDHYRRRQTGGRTMEESRKPDTVFVQILERPDRKLILKRGRRATHYFEYCDEVGCEVWSLLAAVKDALHEPMGLWMPEAMRPPGTSEYVQGVEVEKDYAGPVPDGFEIVDLPACRMMVFQGPPFADEEFESAITSLWDVMASYDPARTGYAWADEDGPRFQLEPQGYRGYIEGRPVRPLAPESA